MRYGFIDKNGGSGVPLEKIQIRGNIKGFTAEVEATMEYKNNGDNPIEAIYVFPLDEEAAVCGFQATIDGRTIVAEIQEKQEARDTYDDAISSGHSAFLLEESDESSDIFQINVGNLPPRQSATVKLTFVTTLTVEKEGRVVFILPTVLNPRYSPSDTNPSVSATMPSIASVSTKYSFDFELDVQCSSPIQHITSPCNQLQVDINPEDNRQAIVRLEEDYMFDADIQVHVLCSKPFEPCVVVENGVTKDDKNDEFLSKRIVMLNFFPSFDSCSSLERSEFIFVVDRSGSMSGSNIKSAKETLLLFLKSLPDECFFNVIGFGSSFEKFFPKSKRYNDSSLTRACSHAESMEADLGGTEILEPLRDVFSQPLIKGYPRQIFLLTDGEVSNTQQVIELVKRNATKARCFSIGIGAGASTALVKGVARAGRGMSEFVAAADKLQAKVIKLLKNALQPALSECTLTWDLPNGCSAKSIPQVPPPIFSGNSLIMYGLITDDCLNTEGSSIKGSITLIATLASGSKGKNIQHKLSLEDLSLKSEEHSLLLHRLASKAWIQEKQDDNDGNAAMNEEIVKLSKSANVVSKLTSFVVVDKDTNKPVSSALVAPSWSDGEELYDCVPPHYCSLVAPSSTSWSDGEELYDLVPPHYCSLVAPSSTSWSDGEELYDDVPLYCDMDEAMDEQLDSLDCKSASLDLKCTGSYKARKSFGNPFSKLFGPQSLAKKNKQSRRSPPPPPLPVSPDTRSQLKCGLSPTLLSAGSNLNEYDPTIYDEDCGSAVERQGSTSQKGCLEMVALQKASGAWQLTAELASVCGVTMDKVKQACPSQLTTDNKDSLWATAIALSCLAGKFAHQKDEWEMVAAKATKWLKAKLSTESLSYDEIMDFASRLLAMK